MPHSCAESTRLPGRPLTAEKRSRASGQEHHSPDRPAGACQTSTECVVLPREQRRNSGLCRAPRRNHGLRSARRPGRPGARRRRPRPLQRCARAVGLVVEVPGRRRVFLPLTRVTSIDAGQVISTGLLNMRRFEQRAMETLAVAELFDRTVEMVDGSGRSPSKTSRSRSSAQETGESTSSSSAVRARARGRSVCVAAGTRRSSTSRP